MNYWLLKSEPSVYSFAQLQRDGKTHWNGVRNYQAANNMRAMKKGDLAFFYHSNEGKEIVGTATIIREAYPDPTDKTGKFVMVDIKPVANWEKPVSLAALKTEPTLKDLQLIKQSRLSVVPVRPGEWKKICQMAGVKP
ncbi:MAG: EVE domain-containing protein [Alphaproteobacteria bacterium]|nr:MAG: EVE domain-containing protein [Alphaproteobacteria bacterium]